MLLINNMPDIINTIKQAAHERKVLKIIYIEKDGTSEGWRYVEPYSFTDGGNEEALFAWDRDKNGIRRFIINRISEAEITSQDFTPRYNIEIKWI
ncbi:MAG: hypothetical protein CO042_02530 [Parcubacteria group bacterium CG_4_9_14_0_2_um_filter_41_8]|nr:MAG: hypothetical protein AUJ34_00880 [Parcubacteria group bacterium CG1_02_41_12]PIQ80182.1 MAG: hypothetical protein COV79_01845 [Parcubacteria group bacterium CG11_big_fil_rev_8_21_14_0_20_41_14]PIR56815.1 MAG: hypothetical protein COU72_04265 [Parcubacteria group bacterium CG10_big_fil_rev_8_21_14_0_10_41_35]PJC40679.1 MAG: hypothetical protein CO042_02530 [Parcubacteria group bacterium CG_4_9_14_0_2_um_filter_41_8]